MRSKDILQEIYQFVGRFIAFPDEKSRVAHTLWVIHTHLIEAFDNTPRLHIVSAEKRCGKTKLLNVTELLVRKPESVVSPSPASLYTLIELERPTLLIDEVDRLFSKKDTGDITAIVNSGFQRGATVSRVVLEPKRKIEKLNVFGPMLLAGIDKHNMPDTILDRCIQIRLKRKTRSEKREQFRPRINGPEGEALRKEIELWAKSALDKARGMSNPSLPQGIEDRNADVWEPLFIVADVTDATAGTPVTGRPGWGERARATALGYISDCSETESVSLGELLLKDVHSIFNDNVMEKVSTTELLDRLFSLEESKWDAFEHGRPLSGAGLARLLRPYGIRSSQIRFDNDEQLRGYWKADFQDAWDRYLQMAAGTAVTNVVDVTAVTNGGASTSQRAPISPPPGWTRSDNAWEAACGRDPMYSPPG